MEQVNNENNKKEGVCPMCNGPRGQWDCACGYGHMHFHRHFWLRAIIALVVVVLIFYMGVKVGEVKEALGLGGYGYHHHFEYMMPVQATPIYGGGGMAPMRGVSGGSTATVSSTPAGY
jgi:hypothetical protein